MGSDSDAKPDKRQKPLQKRQKLAAANSMPSAVGERSDSAPVGRYASRIRRGCFDPMAGFTILSDKGLKFQVNDGNRRLRIADRIALSSRRGCRARYSDRW